MNETPEEKREAAAIRRRWITLGEVLAVIAVLISGATLWNSYQERKSAEAERLADADKQTRAETALVLRAAVEDDGRRLALTTVAGEQAIQSQRLFFPTRLGVKPVETVGDARIEAGWIAGQLKKAGAETDGAGDLRVPVAIVTRFASKGAVRTDAALYELAYVREGGFLGGSSIRLRGLSLVDRIDASRAQAGVDSRLK